MSTSPGAKPAPAPAASRLQVLLVDDDPALLAAYGRTLTEAGFAVTTASNGREAVERIASASFAVILSDISMPGMDGLQLVRAVRERDLDVPVVLMTGDPTLDTAVRAVEYGALRYLTKPVEVQQLVDVVNEAARLHAVAVAKRTALELYGGKFLGDRASLEARFGSALKSVWMAFQPIVSWSRQAVTGYEALVRSGEPLLPTPPHLLDAAERLDRLHDLGRLIRSQVAAAAPLAKGGEELFVNLHSQDLLDETLYHPSSPLSAVARRVVLEVTERASLDDIPDVPSRMAALRKLGYRIAVDDLGAGYAGLTSFARLEPDVVKLDMVLIRDVHREPIKQKLIRSMTTLCAELGKRVIAEGVENREERDALLGQGCDLLQGYLFAKPDRPFVAVRW